MCSETEVTNASCVLKNGFIAFMYLKDINWERAPEEIIPITEAITAPNTKIEFLIRVDSLLKIWTINNIAVKIVGKITEKIITLTSGLSKPNTVNNIEIENVGIAQNKNFLSLWKNVNAIKKIANGIKKNWLPPQAARLNPRTTPPEINLTNEILPLFIFMADKNR